MTTRINMSRRFYVHSMLQCFLTYSHFELFHHLYNAYCSSFRKYTPELCDRPTAPLELKIRMLRAEVLGAVLYGYVT